ncbi:hypothetical protein BpHYR1_049433 [Brachionus plicatilis]|uniref:Uncharacterized protein n=1 Tax=Brachionus plicatilis TaxID=10195 RepID=A0A3M7R2F3_BRAPC|nr:hypothetical protein BpHYR1_049433 [Brachionus plicatilis]
MRPFNFLSFFQNPIFIWYSMKAKNFLHVFWILMSNDFPRPIAKVSIKCSSVIPFLKCNSPRSIKILQQFQPLEGTTKSALGLDNF